LVRKPSVFLLDEPLSNLDAALRSEVRLEIAKLHNDIGGTMIYVTHDQIEAMTLADRIVVLRDGVIEQVGTPRELYETPANAFVGTFIGSPRMSLLKTTREGVNFGIDGSGAIALSDAPETGGQVTLGARPDAMRLAPEGADDGFEAEFEYAEYLGNDAYIYARLGDGTRVSIQSDAKTSPCRPGDKVRLRLDPSEIHYFDSETGRSFCRKSPANPT
jgi:multiple sugar transport system ATP-binding protein